MSTKQRTLPRTLDLLAVVAAQLALSAIAKASGFTAISDDDYSRVVIAQQFVQTPSVDPSGTSWLPFPFLHQGIAMALFSSSLDFARLWAFVTAAGASCLLYGAARLWKIPPHWSILAALAAMSLPYASILSIATVPEYLTGALITFGAAAASRKSNSPRLMFAGSLSFFLACSSRYEAWPAAFAFACLCLWDGWSRRPGAALGAAALAISFPALWMLHGIVHHENALFFIKRVVDYKEALGGASPAGLDVARQYLIALVLAEPEVVFALCGLLALCAWGKLQAGSWGTWWRPWVIALALFGTLLIGALRSGAPTHHAERALLSIWLVASLSVSRLVIFNRRRWKLALLGASAYLLMGIGARRAGGFERAPFADRSAEESLGRSIASATSPQSEIALAMDDYGYFAVMAAAGSPSRFTVLATHDPRANTNAGDALQSYKEQGGCLYVVPTRIPLGRDAVVAEEPGKWQLRRSTGCQ